MPKTKTNVLETIATSNAANKLADTIQGVVDHLAGPKRIIATAQARAEARVLEAKADIAVEELRRISADRGRSPDERRAANVAAIVYEGFAALPSPTSQPSSEPVSDDFVLRFFDDARNVSDAQMQQLWGRLLAGEVMAPGSFHPTTLATLKNMNKEDAEAFARLCRLRWVIDTQPAIMLMSLRSEDDLAKIGLTFDHIVHFEGLGLLRLEVFTTFAVGDLKPTFTVLHHDTRLTFTLPAGNNEIRTGHLVLTRPGEELSGLVRVEPLAGHLESMLERWRADGVGVGAVESVP